jgi:hypothetical protein
MQFGTKKFEVIVAMKNRIARATAVLTVAAALPWCFGLALALAQY